MKLSRQILFSIAAFVLAGTSLAYADVITDRKAGFRNNVTALKAIRAAIGENDTVTIAANAHKIADWFAVMTDYFPEGSHTGDTNARTEIWTEWDKFTALSQSSEAAARNLAMSAEAEDGDAINQGFRDVAGTCKTCHQSFKN